MNSTSLLLLSSALALGFRHGIDWDHVAAIMDIVGSVPSSANRSVVARPKKRAITLSSCYVLGHALVVAMLGIAALSCSLVIPKWLDPVMERFVGITLIILGICVLYALIQFGQGAADLKLQSRWMLIFAGMASCRQWIAQWLTRRPEPVRVVVGPYGRRAAFGVGMIHGIGAETGTQVILIAALGGAASHGLGLAMLAAFLIGLVVSNTVIAALGAVGFLSLADIKPLYVTFAAVVGLFSLTIGACFAFGQADRLPDLQRLVKVFP